MLIDQLTEYLETHGVDIALKLAAAVGVLAGAFIVGKLASRSAAKAIRRSSRKRAHTLASVVQGLVFATVMAGGAITALDQVGIDVTTLLAGAGVLGLAIGFGAQALVRDLLSGFFLLLDDILGEGDIVDVDGKSGTVEKIGLRVTRIRSFDGVLWHVRNGDIQVVGNYNRGWVRAVVGVGLAYEQDVADGMAVLREVGTAWAAENEAIVLEPPEVQGVLGFGASDVGVRLVVKLDNSSQSLWASERELRLRIKQAFDDRGIEIPFSRQVVYHRQEGSDALRVTGETSGRPGAASVPSPS
jgi:small conductance mechanosensitive channel